MPLILESADLKFWIDIAKYNIFVLDSLLKWTLVDTLEMYLIRVFNQLFFMLFDVQNC